jgi:hypothetical protein
MIYNPKNIIGDFFEKKVAGLFDLVLADASNSPPDLVSRDGSFYVEVKASAYNNGGVINGSQLSRFDESVAVRRFYAFAYHSLGKDIQRNYPSENLLLSALDLRSLFLFPFSIVKAHFDAFPKKYDSSGSEFVQLRENVAKKIFCGDETVWDALDISVKDYNAVMAHENVYIVTRNGNLEQNLLKSFNPENI